MMAANYRHIGGGENRLGRHYSRFAGIWPTSFLADQSLTLRKSQNAGSNRPSRAREAFNELAHPRLVSKAADDAHFQTEIAQRAAQIGLYVQQLALKQLAAS